jgi:hypothetical protein
MTENEAYQAMRGTLATAQRQAVAVLRNAQPETDSKAMYKAMLKGQLQAIEFLQKAHQEAEEIYMTVAGRETPDGEE